MAGSSDHAQETVGAAAPIASLTTSEVAKELRVSGRAVRMFIDRGDLEAFNVGVGSIRPSYRVSREALATFIAARTMTPGVGA